VSLLWYVFGSIRYSNIDTHLGGVSDFSMFVLLVLFSYLDVLFTRISLRTSINRQGQSSQVWVGKESDPDTKIISTNNIGRGRAQGYSSKQYIQIRK
jgi:hypothetical protein